MTNKRATPSIPPKDADIWKIVDREQVTRLYQRRFEPVASNEDYFADAGLRLQIQLVVSQASDALLQPQTLSSPASIDSARRLLDDSLISFRCSKDWFECRRKSTRDRTDAPRIIRLAKRLQLTAAEQDVLDYLIAVNSLPTLTKRFAIYENLHEVASLCRLDATAYMELEARSSRLMTEGVVDLEEPSLVSRGRRMEISVSPETVKALWGLQLTDTELLKLEGTAVFEVLKEEPEYSRRLTRPERRSEADQGLSTEKADAEEQSRAFDIEDLLTTGARPRIDSQKTPGDPDDDDPASRPFRNDAEYLHAQVDRLVNLVALKNIRVDDGFPMREENKPSRIRKLKTQISNAAAIIESRLQATIDAGYDLPRLASLSKKLNLDPFEVDILAYLLARKIAPEAIKYHWDESTCKVEDLLTMFSPRIEDRIRNRRFFYKDARLVADGIIQLESGFADLNSATVSVEPRIEDFLIGLELSESQQLDGSHLYQPNVDLDQVVLPAEKKDLVIRTVTNYQRFAQARIDLGFDDVVAYGRGLLLLFYGPSGTGKTMLANALANRIGKRVLLVNFPTLGSVGEAVLRFLFREARLQDAVLFFDECEEMFGQRDPTLLTEIERHDGLAIMATNRPQNLDEAMHRRITLAVEFQRPDEQARNRIWALHMPPKVEVDDGVDLRELARKYPLTGGLIKNAVLAAISEAVARGHEPVRLMQADLETGARNQLRGALRIGEFEQKLTPKAGLDSLVLSESTRAQLDDIVREERGQQVLFGHWGFDRDSQHYSTGTAVLFSGPPGTGKTLTAEAIGFEMGRPLRLVRTAELLSAYVGETAKNLDTVFRQASDHDAILLFDEADSLFGARTDIRTSTDKYANTDLNVLLRAIDDFAGLVILTSNLDTSLDDALRRRLKYVVRFERPNVELRKQLWRSLMPEGVALANDVDLDRLAAAFDFTGANIRNVIYRASCRAAAIGGVEAVVSHADFEAAAQQETGSPGGKRIGFSVQQTV